MAKKTSESKAKAKTATNTKESSPSKTSAGSKTVKQPTNGKKVIMDKESKIAAKKATSKKASNPAPKTKKKIEVNAQNVDEVIQNAPTAEEAEKAKSENKSTQSKVEALSAAPEAISDQSLRVYSDSIRNSCQNHWRLISVKEVDELLVRGAYPFSYEIKANPAQPQNQIYVEIKNETGQARIPNNPNEFINVNG